MNKDSEKEKYSSSEGSYTWEYITTLLNAFATVVLGFVIGWSSPSLAELMSPNSRIPTSPEQASTLAASASVGHILSLVISPFLVDRFGKKTSMLASIIPLIFHWGLIVFAETIWLLYFARMIVGCSMGLIIFVIPLYMGETLSPRFRGRMMASTLISYNCGVLFMFTFGPILGLRITATVCMAVTILFLICFWFAPESPYFLMNVGRVEEAETSLRKLRGKTDVAEEIELIKATLSEKGETSLDLKDTENNDAPRKQNIFVQLFTIRGNLKALFIVILFMILQVISGFGIIQTYFHIIFQSMGVDIDMQKASTLFGLIQITSGLVSLLFVDKFKRRTLILICGMLVTAFLTVIGTYFFLMEYTRIEVKQYYAIPYFSILFYFGILNIGILIVPAAITSELLGSDVKVLSCCISGIAGTLVSIVCTKTYLLIAISWNLGHCVPLLSYALLTFICISLVVWLLPETKDKTLIEIQKSLNA